MFNGNNCFFIYKAETYSYKKATFLPSPQPQYTNVVFSSIYFSQNMECRTWEQV